jgi:N-acetylneuraminate synthase
MNKTFVIAEIGICHGGDINVAKQLIDVAVAAGCDAVKFQTRTLPDCIPVEQRDKPKETPWGTITYLEYKEKIEFDYDDYNVIDEYCKDRIQWSTSVWDVKALRYITDKFDLPWLKLPSAMLTHKELVEKSAAWCIGQGKKFIISTGMSTQEEIDNAIEWIDTAKARYISLHNSVPDGYELVIMHCNSTYPAPVDELNLSAIKTLKEKYPFATIGYSGHEFRLGTSVSAVYLGAEYIERHITMDRSVAWLSDSLSSVEPQGLIKLVSGVRELERAFGDGKICVTDSEKPVRKKLRG